MSLTFASLGGAAIGRDWNDDMAEYSTILLQLFYSAQARAGFRAFTDRQATQPVTAQA
jgi:hypothetical protein